MIIKKIWKCLLPQTLSSFIPKVPQTASLPLSLNYKFANFNKPNQEKDKLKQSKDNDNDTKIKLNLQNFIEQYRTQLNSRKYELSDYAGIYKNIANYYSKARHYQFIKEKEWLQKMLDSSTTFTIQQTSLSNFIDMLDFLIVVEKVQNIKKKLIWSLKDILFLNLVPYLAKVNEMSFSQLLKIYCRLAALNHHESSQLSFKFLEKLEKKVGTGEEPIKLKEIQTIFRYLGKRVYLSRGDRRIIKILLIEINSRMSKLQLETIVRLADVINSCNIKLNTADELSINFTKQILKAAREGLKQGFNSKLTDYILLKDCSSGLGFKQIHQVLYSQLLQKIKIKQIDINLIKRFTSVCTLLRGKEFHKDDILIVSEYIKHCFTDQQQNKIVFRYIKAEVVTLNLINAGFFDCYFEAVDSLVKMNEFNVYWTLVAQYSIRNVPFPSDILSRKLKPKSSIFCMDTNYLKMSISLSIQSKLQPGIQIIQTSSTQLIQNIKCSQWNTAKIQWLLKQSIASVDMVRLFYRQFGQHFMPMLIKQKQLEHKQQYQQQLLKYQFQVLYLTIHGYDNPLYLQILPQMPIQAISIVVHRERGKPSQKIVLNQVLLKAIQINIQNDKISSEGIINQIIQLLSHYRQELSYTSDQSLELYFRVVSLFAIKMKKMNKDKLSRLYSLFYRLVGIQDMKILNSIYYSSFLKYLTPQIYNIYMNRQKNLIFALIKKAAHLNLLHEDDFSFFKNYDQNYFNQTDINYMNGLKGVYQANSLTLQSLKISLKNNNTAFLTAQQTQINQLIQNGSLQDLTDILLFFNFKKEQPKQTIFLQICNRLIQKATPQINFITILNIVTKPLLNLDKPLYLKLINTIATHISQSPSSHALLNHYMLLRQMQFQQYSNKVYNKALWKHIVHCRQKSGIVLSIALQICKMGYKLNRYQVAYLSKIQFKNQQAAKKMKKQKIM